MNYIVMYGMEMYGPYEDWASAFWFAMTTFGLSGWRIYRNGK